MSTTRAVVLARGLGTRMREADPDAQLSEEQQRAADAGLKPMMRVNGRPFLDYVLSALADAGLTEVALVVAPDHEAVRRYYTAVAPPSRIRLDYVVQAEPRGTANAVLAAEPWTAGERFLALNADNLYPAAALADLARLSEPGLPAFDRDDLVRSGNIPAERIKSFALIEVDDDGYLTGIVEKPTVDPNPTARAERARPLPRERSEPFDSHDPALAQGRPAELPSAFRRKDQVLVSMNCWHFDARIFDACRDVPRSVRGEFELPEAVGLAVRRGIRFRALAARGAVLDLSRRADAAEVERRLTGIVPNP
jgi:glucose-1-phosphate thymidylyltransferase